MHAVKPQVCLSYRCILFLHSGTIRPVGSSRRRTLPLHLRTRTPTSTTHRTSARSPPYTVRPSIFTDWPIPATNELVVYFQPAASPQSAAEVEPLLPVDRLTRFLSSVPSCPSFLPGHSPGPPSVSLLLPRIQQGSRGTGRWTQQRRWVLMSPALIIFLLSPPVTLVTSL